MAAAVVFMLALPKPMPWRDLMVPLPSDGDALLLRGGGEADSLRVALQLQAQDQHLRVLLSLQHPYADPALEVFRQLVVANSLAQNGKYSAAEQMLSELPLNSLPSPWREHSIWLHYITRRALLDHDGADSVLQQLAEDPGEFGERARRELR